MNEVGPPSLSLPPALPPLCLSVPPAPYHY